MILPQRPEKGIKIKPWLVSLWEFCRSLQISGDGRTTKVTRTPNGTVISCIPPPQPTPGTVAGGSSGGAGYNGYFKVISELDENKNVVYKVVDGEYPTGKICGYTDIGVVYAGTVAYRPGYQLNIYLKAERKGNIYEFSFCDNEYGSAIQLLATVRDGIIYQQWQGGVIYFSSRYMV